MIVEQIIRSIFQDGSNTNIVLHRCGRAHVLNVSSGSKCTEPLAGLSYNMLNAICHIGSHFSNSVVQKVTTQYLEKSRKLVSYLISHMSLYMQDGWNRLEQECKRFEQVRTGWNTVETKMKQAGTRVEQVETSVRLRGWNRVEQVGTKVELVGTMV